MRTIVTRGIGGQGYFHELKDTGSTVCAHTKQSVVHHDILIMKDVQKLNSGLIEVVIK